MLSFIKNILSRRAQAIDFAQLIAAGAQIIDVRTVAEFNGGHVEHAVNIPLDQLSARFTQLDVAKPVITCCASGLRSARAKSLLQQKGFTNVVNGGGWLSLREKLHAL